MKDTNVDPSGLLAFAYVPLGCQCYCIAAVAQMCPQALSPCPLSSCRMFLSRPLPQLSHTAMRSMPRLSSGSRETPRHPMKPGRSVFLSEVCLSLQDLRNRSFLPHPSSPTIPPFLSLSSPYLSLHPFACQGSMATGSPPANQNSAISIWLRSTCGGGSSSWVGGGRGPPPWISSWATTTGCGKWVTVPWAPRPAALASDPEQGVSAPPHLSALLSLLSLCYSCFLSHR